MKIEGKDVRKARTYVGTMLSNKVQELSVVAVEAVDGNATQLTGMQGISSLGLALVATCCSVSKMEGCPHSRDELLGIVLAIATAIDDLVESDKELGEEDVSQRMLEKFFREAMEPLGLDTKVVRLSEEQKRNAGLDEKLDLSKLDLGKLGALGGKKVN